MVFGWVFFPQCENNAALTTMHSPAHKNILVPHKGFKRVDVVILKLESDSGRGIKDVHPAVASRLYHKEIPPS